MLRERLLSFLVAGSIGVVTGVYIFQPLAAQRSAEHTTNIRGTHRDDNGNMKHTVDTESAQPAQHDSSGRNESHVLAAK